MCRYARAMRSCKVFLKHFSPSLKILGFITAMLMPIHCYKHKGVHFATVPGIWGICRSWRLPSACDILWWLISSTMPREATDKHNLSDVWRSWEAERYIRRSHIKCLKEAPPDCQVSLAHPAGVPAKCPILSVFFWTETPAVPASRPLFVTRVSRGFF